jgi:hypothetical protein
MRFQVLTVGSMKPPSSELIVLMMEAASTSESSVNFYQTVRRNIPEDTFM